MLASHSANLGYNFEFCNHKILDKERNLEKRLFFFLLKLTLSFRGND